MSDDKIFLALQLVGCVQIVSMINVKPQNVNRFVLVKFIVHNFLCTQKHFYRNADPRSLQKGIWRT